MRTPQHSTRNDLLLLPGANSARQLTKFASLLVLGLVDNSVGTFADYPEYIVLIHY